MATETQPRLTRSWMTPDRAVIIGLVLAAAVYCRDLSYDFILDDVPLILTNPNLASWRNWKTAFTADIFSQAGPLVPAVHYRPVYMLWLLLNQQLFGAVVPWWHLTSLLLHMFVTFLVYQVALKLLRDPWTAALAALLFAFHPIHAEPVTYVSASTDLLVALFTLASFLFYVGFREEGKPRVYYAIAILAGALAMLSKETGAMFPWMLVAYEGVRQPGQPSTVSTAHRDWKRFAWTIPFFAVVAVYALTRMLLFGRDVVPGGQRLGGLHNIPVVLVAYLRNVLWPVRLGFYYPPEWATQWTLAKSAAIIFAALAAVLLWKLFRDSSGLRLQLLWTAILIVPPLTGIFVFAQEDWIHDRHMYLASVPFCLIAAVLLSNARLPKTSTAFASALLLSFLLLETAAQLPRFRDEITLYRSTLQTAPTSPIVHSHYASALWNSGQHDQAFDQFRLAIEIEPKSAFYHKEYAAALSETARDDEAVAQYMQALRWATRPTPLRALILYSLATIEVSHSNFQAGADHMREALQIAPKATGYHALLAQALRQEGDMQEADQQMQLETETVAKRE